MAALPKSPIAHLVVNDVGPVIEPEALTRINSYYREVIRRLPPTLRSRGHTCTHSAPCSAISPMRSGSPYPPNARGTTITTPGIAVPFGDTPAPPDIWSIWDAIRCPYARASWRAVRSPVRDNRGGDEQPRAQTGGWSLAGVGHAPMLLKVPDRPGRSIPAQLGASPHATRWLEARPAQDGNAHVAAAAAFDAARAAVGNLACAAQAGGCGSR